MKFSKREDIQPSKISNFKNTLIPNPGKESDNYF